MIRFVAFGLLVGCWGPPVARLDSKHEFKILVGGILLGAFMATATIAAIWGQDYRHVQLELQAAQLDAQGVKARADAKMAYAEWVIGGLVAGHGGPLCSDARPMCWRPEPLKP